MHVSLNPSCGLRSDHFYYFLFLLILIISCSLVSLGPSSCSLALTMHKEQAAVGAGSCLPCGLLPTPLKQQNLQDSGWGCLGRGAVLTQQTHPSLQRFEPCGSPARLQALLPALEAASAP